MKTKKTKSCNVSVPNRPPEGSEWLTRAKVSEALNCSVATVRRMEGTALHPILDADDVHRFDPLEVIHLLRERSSDAVDRLKEGERDARVFEMLDTGKGVRDIVTTLRLPVDVVSKLSDRWKEVGRGDLVLPPACRTELERILGPARDAAGLTEQVRTLDAERERVESEKDKVSNTIEGVIAMLGELAARSSDVERALPDLKSELSPEQIDMLHRTVKNHRKEVATARATEPRDEAEDLGAATDRDAVTDRSRP